MKVSVLIPVYNKEAFVAEAVRSVLEGSFADLEVVAVDDASTDGSLKVLQEIRDPRLRIIALPGNLGPAGAANEGIDACRGEYIVRLDADDIALPERIAKQVAFMDAHPTVGAGGGSVELFGDSERLWTFPRTNEECRAQLLFGVPVSQGASIMRRSVLEQHTLRYDPAWPRVGEDWLFWTRLSRFAEFGNLADPVIRYRRGEQNISHGRDRIADHSLLLREVFNFFGLALSDAEIDLHLYALRMFREAPDAAKISAYRAWLDHLKHENARMGLFPPSAFHQRLEEAWNGLFHYLPRYGNAPALAHLRLSGWKGEHIMYLAKLRVSTLLGRTPSHT